MLDRRKTKPCDGGQKRRRTLYDSTATGSEQATTRRQSWICEEVGRTIRRMRMSFFACSLVPSVETSKLGEYGTYVESFRSSLEAEVPQCSTLADSRSSLLELSQYKHFEFDTLRRAKYSTYMLLTHIHNPNVPGCVPRCYSCGLMIENVRWHKAVKIEETNKTKKGLSRSKSVAAPKVTVMSCPPNGDLCTKCYESSDQLDDDFIPIPVSIDLK